MNDQTTKKRRERVAWNKLGWDHYLFVFDSHHKVAEMMDKNEHSVYNRKWNFEKKNPELAESLKNESFVTKHNRVVEFYQRYGENRFVPREFRNFIEENDGTVSKSTSFSDRIVSQAEPPAIEAANEQSIQFVSQPETQEEQISIEYKGHIGLVPKNTARIIILEDQIVFRTN